MPRTAVEPDDAAADSFLLSIVTAILVILLLNKFRASSKTRSEFESWIEIGFALGSPVVAKAAKLENASRKSWWKPSFGTLLLIIFAGAEALLLQKTLFADGPTAPFDPHAALGIDESANSTEIKAAYRRLALEFHPDKNPDPSARTKFTAISKAHKILTDPKAADNFRKYGNPDGYQGFVGGFGLPSWMLDESALIPLICLVLGLPLLALYFTRDPTASQSRTIAQNAAQVYFHALNTASTSSKQPNARPTISAVGVGPSKLLRLVAASYTALPFKGGLTMEQRLDLLSVKPSAASAASSSTASSATAKGSGKKKAAKKGKKKGKAAEDAEGEEAAEVAEEEEETKAEEAAPPPNNAEREAEAASIGVVEAREWLLSAYLHRYPPIPKSLQDELGSLLLHAPAVCEAFFAISLRAKKLSLSEGVLPILQLAQCLTQAVPHYSKDNTAASALSSLLQLPHVTLPGLSKLANALSSSGGGGQGSKKEKDSSGGAVPNVRTMSDVLSLTTKSRDALLTSMGTFGVEASSVQQRREVHTYCSSVFPRASVSLKTIVKGEEDAKGPSVVVGDVLTVMATLKVGHRWPRKGGMETAANMPMLPTTTCHAPLYPHKKTEGWVLVLTTPNGGKVLGVASAPGWEGWTADVTNGGGSYWTGELPMHVEQAGKLKLEVHAICSAYVGGDALGKVEVEVASRPRDEDESEDDEERGEEVEFDDEVYESDGVESD